MASGSRGLQCAAHQHDAVELESPLHTEIALDHHDALSLYPVDIQVAVDVDDGEVVEARIRGVARCPPVAWLADVALVVSGVQRLDPVRSGRNAHRGDLDERTPIHVSEFEEIAVADRRILRDVRRPPRDAGAAGAVRTGETQLGGVGHDDAGQSRGHGTAGTGVPRVGEMIGAVDLRRSPDDGLTPGREGAAHVDGQDPELDHLDDALPGHLCFVPADGLDEVGLVIQSGDRARVLVHAGARPTIDLGRCAGVHEIPFRGDPVAHGLVDTELRSGEGVDVATRILSHSLLEHRRGEGGADQAADDDDGQDGHHEGNAGLVSNVWSHHVLAVTESGWAASF